MKVLCGAHQPTDSTGVINITMTDAGIDAEQFNTLTEAQRLRIIAERLATHTSSGRALDAAPETDLEYFQSAADASTGLA